MLDLVRLVANVRYTPAKRHHDARRTMAADYEP